MTSPQDGWFKLLVGHQWPSQASLSVLDSSCRRRSDLATATDRYADQLAFIRNGTLATQQGLAAERVQQTFDDGERKARDLAVKNHTKNRAYSAAHTHIVQLRSELSNIAAAGISAIQLIESSEDSRQTKLTKVAAVVVNSQSQANLHAAKHAEQIFNAIQITLEASGLDIPARSFARSNKVEVDTSFGSANPEAVGKAVAERLSSSLTSEENSELVEHAGPNLVALGETPDSHRTQEHTIQGSNQRGHDVVINGVTPEGGSLAPSTPSHNSAQNHAQTLVGNAETSSGIHSVPPIQTTKLSGLSETTTFNTPTRLSATTAAPTPATPSELLAQSHTPTDLAHSLNTGPQAGAPVSIGAEASSANAVQAAHQTPTHSPVMPTPPMPPAVPLATGTEAAVAHAAVEPTAPPTVIAAPQAPAPTAAPVPPPIAVSTPTPPTNALPAYGADLRVPAATVPAASPTPAAPASAHLTSSPTSTLGQPSVVRHHSAPQAATTATALTERAVAATATGSIAGAAVGHSIAVQRLRQLLTSVARQAPELGWAIGDRNDHTTVLATDLASGWIPPNIHIPSGVVLLDTGMRSGSLTNMLGETTHIATHAPGQHLPPADLDAPPTSTRPRKLAPVDELNWELAQATKWRDGLPRLAHTLARAIASGTGYLESEVHLLRDALDSTGRQALDTYPNTDPNLIGNWQLLATIDALINGETMCANYHLAWFGALSPTGSSKR